MFFKTQITACQGDSGGPAVWDNEEDKRSYVIGILSHPNDCFKSGFSTDDTPVPDTFVKIPGNKDTIDWIIQEGGKELKECLVDDDDLEANLEDEHMSQLYQSIERLQEAREYKRDKQQAKKDKKKEEEKEEPNLDQPGPSQENMMPYKQENGRWKCPCCSFDSKWISYIKRHINHRHSGTLDTLFSSNHNIHKSSCGFRPFN